MDSSLSMVITLGLISLLTTGDADNHGVLDDLVIMLHMLLMTSEVI